MALLVGVVTLALPLVVRAELVRGGDAFVAGQGVAPSAGAHALECQCALCGGAHLLTGDSHDDAMQGLDPFEAAQQYTLQGGKWAQSSPAAPVTITYSYNNFLNGGLRGPDDVPLSTDFLRASVETAFSLWAAVAPLHFVEVEDEGGPSVGHYPAGQFGQIRFHHRYINGPDVPGEPPTTKALAYLPSGPGNLAGDVYFDNGDPWQEAGVLSIPDVLGAATHEIGHALGLGHSAVANANMYWIFRRSEGLHDGWLHPDDIAGMQAVYGIGAGSVTPLGSVVPEPATAALLAYGLALLAVRRHCRRGRDRSARG